MQYGYRHVTYIRSLSFAIIIFLTTDQIDSATEYCNQGPAAQSIASAGVPRNQAFFTTKIPFNHHEPRLSYENAHTLVDVALKDTGLSYLDLVLIHAPYGGPVNRKGAWRALVECVEAGKIRSIGISNYGVHHLNELEAYIQELEAERGKGKGGVISVGQWEIHPWLCRKDVVQWCQERNIAIEAYCPITRGLKLNPKDGGQVKEPLLRALSEKYGKTEAQILLRWSLQSGLVPLVKSEKNDRIKENCEIFDFELDGAEVDELATEEYTWVSWDPTLEPLEN